ncbi:copper transporter crmD [Penicillium daleae]|uniref:Copper transport protein n=1 Tax=Penicillium daleae TaxID=63821 RepID=A0AAD6G4G4_9EURO|nr:copper transporter crmD [Penicillium daleae]KAJ5456024.1 copper transporter crmD [Penicillium daleae]
MPTVFVASTKLTLLFSWWSTDTVFSFLVTLLVLFSLTVLNQYLGALKFQLDQQKSRRESHEDVPHFDPLPSCWPRNRASKDRVSPLPMNIEFDDDSTTHTDAGPTIPSSGFRYRLCPDDTDRPNQITSDLKRWSAAKRRSWRQGCMLALFEGVRAFLSYTL